MPDAHSWADIDLQALQHNLGRAREFAPGKRVCAVIKANAYGHGVHAIAEALLPVLNDGDCVAVATLNEALALRQTLEHLQSKIPVLVLRGPLDIAELDALVQGGFHWVMHSKYQAELLKNWLDTHSAAKKPTLNIWLKINTGMNRLGLRVDDLQPIWSWLQSLDAPGERVLMSHFATADEHDHALAKTQQQTFAQITDNLSGARTRSLSASAGIVSWPDAHHSIIRPGIMLYGASPMTDTDATEYGLKPVMSLKSRLLTINQVKAGDTVGYGATYHCKENMPVGVIGIGYGDGYPRHAPSGTPVLIYAQGKVWEAPLAGRVSMDMLTVDLRGIPATPGDEVLLWGQSWGRELPADIIARYAGTIAYELFCQVTSRVKFIYR
ncbi:MAG: alanine racemase [Pseudohongiella sp.]|nr:alanine racemase [Pseudohongiella sp.]